MVVNGISVAMATFNGEKYLEEQLDSIVSQLDESDELIISDDGSTDSTVDIINSYLKKYNFIKLYKNNGNHGVVSNFENALNKCTKEIIFLSDQDDLWDKNKKQKVLECFYNNDCSLVLHNAKIYNTINDEFEKIDMFQKLGFSDNLFKVILKNPYIGCCMAFRKDLLKICLPFPPTKDITIHDWWIAICAIKTGKCQYLNESLINYRIHNNNTLGFNKTTLLYKLKKRFNMLKCLFKMRRRFNYAYNKEDI